MADDFPSKDEGLISFFDFIKGWLSLSWRLPTILRTKKQVENMSKNSKRCWQPGCPSTDTIKCQAHYLDDDGEWHTDKSRYCHDHAKDNGFCSCCGIFSAGVESYDFIHPGLCDNCYDEIQAEMSWESEEKWLELLETNNYYTTR